ncbi:hypothetical protein EXN66_Car014898 [Channa argus]|uniref:Uncharacterized protein n=1 Tax=Channa argus TaxID=215402 RepID=A0A6G1Q9A2_CHAAH|nr:hypothetical protein EXN66_Car014898 [Channa argus]
MYSNPKMFICATHHHSYYFTSSVPMDGWLKTASHNNYSAVFCPCSLITRSIENKPFCQQD